jgi:hypothetical protein
MPEGFPDISAWVERVSKVKIGGGVVGKVTTVLIFICISTALIAWAARLWWVSLVGLVLMFGLCAPLLWRLVNFAERNPYAALFEGAELLAHERMKFGTKENPVLPTTPPMLPPGDDPNKQLPDADDNSPT